MESEYHIFKITLTDGNNEIMYMIGALDERRAVILAQYQAIMNNKGVDLVSVEKSMPPNDTTNKGKLKKLYKNKILKDYINGKTIGGYLNHGNRNCHKDLSLEKMCNKEYEGEFISEDTVATWIRSKNARHFMDKCDNDKYFDDNIMEEISDFASKGY